jgi:hypothetical protein
LQKFSSRITLSCAAKITFAENIVGMPSFDAQLLLEQVGMAMNSGCSLR